VEKEGKAWEKRKVFSLDLKTAEESLLRTVFGSEFQTAGVISATSPVYDFQKRFYTAYYQNISVSRRVAFLLFLQKAD